MTPTWKDRITDLVAADWSLTKIAEATGLSVQSLSDIKQGRINEPRGMPAVKLFHLHEAECVKPAPASDKKAA